MTHFHFDYFHGKSEKSLTKEAVMMFITETSTMFIQDEVKIEKPNEFFLGAQVPNLLFAARTDQNEITLMHNPMKHFSSIKSGNESMKDLLMDFSFNLITGNIEKAYQLVRLVKTPRIWENMARMCIKAERLDLAGLCLSNMGHSRGAEAARIGKLKSGQDVAFASMAVQLGLLDEAKYFYERCSQFHHLNEFYQNQGFWEEALLVAKGSDKINLRNTHFLYAKFLASLGEISSANFHFEASGSKKEEIAALFLNNYGIEALYDHAFETNDLDLCRWLAAYYESIKDYETVYSLLSKTSDSLNLVRLACHQGKLNLASTIVRESNDFAAAYQLGRQYEKEGKFHIAITLYKKSGLFKHAIRLAKSKGLNSEVFKLAMMSKTQIMKDCANFLQQSKEYEMSVDLFIQCNMIDDAIELSLQLGGEIVSNRKLLDTFLLLVDKLSKKSDKNSNKKFAAFLISYECFEKAIDILCVYCKEFEKAFDLCIDKNILLNESLADTMIPPKRNDSDVSRRISMLQKIANLCSNQKKFQLACKIYTLAGDKLNAIKSLLKCGDTRKIINYANLSKQRNIYIIVANYLQAM